MRFYYFMMRRYNRGWQQVKCFALFITVMIGAYVATNLLKSFWLTGYRTSLLLLGWLTATFIEYVLHRFWMHDHKHSKVSSVIASYHHHHHTHPTEIKITRLLRLLFALAGVAVLYLCMRLQTGVIFFGGLYFGFCSYAFMHYAIHQRWAQRLFPKLTRYHTFHHCKFPNACFGVTITWWDEVFGTTPPKGAVISERIAQFYLHGNNHRSSPSLPARTTASAFPNKSSPSLAANADAFQIT